MNKKIKNNIECLFILDEESIFIASSLKKDKLNRIISNRKELNEFTQLKFQIKNVGILVELDWNTHVSQFYGYEIAKKLMESSNREGAFNLLFISTLERKTIFHLNTGKNRVFTKKFPHVQITSVIDIRSTAIPELSNRKFDYLKNYCLLESGIIDRIEHNIRNLIANIESPRLKEVIQEIEANRDILTQNILDKTQIIKSEENSDKSKLKESLQVIHQLLLQQMSEMNNPVEAEQKKSNSVVMLIEDEPETLKTLEQQLGDFFETIRTFQAGTDAYNELKKNADEYDVILTDMELLDGDYDDEIQGIDILELCENEYPFMVTRVITSLPKNALKRLTGKGFDEIIFKSVTSESIIPPFENLSEFVQQIDKEVKKRRALRSITGPKISWWGKYLTKQLYLTKIKDPEEYSEIWNMAMDCAEKFISGQFDDLNNEEKLSIEFKQVNDTIYNPQSGWDIIDRLLTHRLIALWYALRHSWEEFYFKGTQNKFYVNQEGFQEGLESRNPKNYFNSFLGLSMQLIPHSFEGVTKCKIIRKNIFPEEINWLGKKNEGVWKDILLEELDYNVSTFFIEFFDIYQEGFLPKNPTFKETLESIEEFIQRYPDEPFNHQKHKQLQDIFERDAEYVYDLLPEKAKNAIDQIREEIFPV